MQELDEELAKELRLNRAEFSDRTEFLIEAKAEVLRRGFIVIITYKGKPGESKDPSQIESYEVHHSKPSLHRLVQVLVPSPEQCDDSFSLALVKAIQIHRSQPR